MRHIVNIECKTKSILKILPQAGCDLKKFGIARINKIISILKKMTEGRPLEDIQFIYITKVRNKSFQNVLECIPKGNRCYLEYTPIEIEDQTKGKRVQMIMKLASTQKCEFKIEERKQNESN